MERLIKRTYFVAFVFLVGGLLIAFSSVQKSVKTESWMEQKLPKNVGAFCMLPGDGNPEQSYRMDQSTYDVLKPFGIVSRVMQDGTKGYDVVVVASRSRESFHDPRVCFTAQGWALLNQKTAQIPTKTRGIVPVTIATMKNDSGEQRLTAFTYKGPNGFYPTTRTLKWAMYKEILGFGNNIDGAFYRFIPNNTDTTEEDLFKFIGNYLDESDKTSSGYF